MDVCARGLYIAFAYHRDSHLFFLCSLPSLLFIYLFKTKLSIMYSLVTYLLIILYLLAPCWGLWPCSAPS